MLDQHPALRKARVAGQEQQRGGDDPAQALEQEHLQRAARRDQRHRQPVELEAALVRDMAEEGLQSAAAP